MNIRSPHGASPADQLKLTRRVADSPENLEKLKQEAAGDGLPSVIARQGKDLLLLSGNVKTESKIAGVSADEGISNGDRLTIDGAQATVLSTDDGFKEIPAKDVIVAVIDTGIDISHPAFEGKIVKPYNAVDGSTDVTDKKKHGTHVAGIIAGAEGINPDAEGVAPQVKIMPIKVAGTFGIGRDSLAEAIRYAVDNGAKVINMSLGSNDIMQGKVKDAITYAYDHGVVIISSSGNDASKNGVNFPASMDREVLAVGSVNAEGQRSRFSNRGPQLDVMAPGEDILSAIPKNEYKALSGTSMAAPYVSGVAALVVARHPDWTVDQVYEHLRNATTDLQQPGWDNETGYGQIDIFKAIYGENQPATQKGE